MLGEENGGNVEFHMLWAASGSGVASIGHGLFPEDVVQTLAHQAPGCTTHIEYVGDNVCPLGMNVGA